MESEDIKNVLELILDLIKNRNITWRLEGSANLKVQGIGCNVNDLDITTNSDGIKIFRGVLNRYIVKDFINDKIKKFFAFHHALKGVVCLKLLDAQDCIHPYASACGFLHQQS